MPAFLVVVNIWLSDTQVIAIPVFAVATQRTDAEQYALQVAVRAVRAEGRLELLDAKTTTQVVAIPDDDLRYQLRRLADERPDLIPSRPRVERGRRPQLT